MSTTLQPAIPPKTLRRTAVRRTTPPRRVWFAFILFSLITVISISILIRFDLPGWDTAIYLRAVHSIQNGHSPYADGVAAQKIEHRLHPNAPSENGPFSYVYSPITLPVLHLAAALPIGVTAAIFWTCYLAGIIGELHFGILALAEEERPYLLPLVPLAIFFPGLLEHDIVLSGNVAYMLYGLILTCTIVAWKRGEWRWFYLAVLAASCVKGPLLSLLAIPVLSARRQWWPALATGLGGLALFAIQPMLWPALFHGYLEAVELQFSFNRDFGFSPAGIFSGMLYDHHIPYSPGCMLFYLGYAIPLFVSLYLLSRRFLGGHFTLQQWMPVLLLGVILLNPRLIEYDAAPLTIPLALIAWRFFASFFSTSLTIVCCMALFAAANVLAGSSHDHWKLAEAPLLIVFFVAGAFRLFHEQPKTSVWQDQIDTSAAAFTAR